MKRLKYLIKFFTVHTIIFSLVQTSLFSTTAQADVTGKDILGVANIALGTYGSFLGQQKQIIQQQIMAQQNMALMQKLSPSCTNPDGTFCYRSAGKFFPECPLPATMSNKPKNVCSETIPDATKSAAQISSMMTYEAIANGWANYYEQMSNEATNATYPAGLKCLSDKTKKLDSEMIEMINNLTRLQDQLNKDKEIFKANNKKLLEELSQANDELLGGSKNNLAIKTTPFAKYFSSSCQSVIGENNIATGAQKGLLGIQQIIAPANKRAADYNKNRTAIEAEVRSDILKIQNSIATGGLADYFAGKVTETSKFKSISVAAQKQAAEFKLAQDRISKEMSSIGYEIPTMDKNFSIDFDEFLKGSSTFFKKSYINNCVTGADKTGIAISTDQILNNLQQKSTNSGGTARDKYKAALQNILQSDSFIDDKLAQIRALESTYKDITITYQSSDGQRVTETPYDLYVRTLSKCEQRYLQDDTFSASGSNGVSQKKKVDRGQALLRELKSLHDNYSSQLSAKALDQVLSCNGETKKSGSSCGSEKSFDHTDESFCMNHASQCANEVNGCYAEATKLVDARKEKMAALAKTFNANAEMMVKRSNQLFNLQKANVMEMVKIIQGRFPGSNFPIPENMFISMPELKKDSFGIDLANDGNMAFMDDLPKKISLLKKVFEDQKEKVDSEISDYVNKQKSAMSEQRAYWLSFAGECKGMIANVTRDLAKYNADGQKRQAEIDGKTVNFCSKYSGLAENPMGACNGVDKLAETADEISSRLTNEALTYTRRFRNLCNQVNNESEIKELEYCDDAPDSLSREEKNNCRNQERNRSRNGTQENPRRGRPISIPALCKDNPTNDSAFFVALNSKLPVGDQSIMKDIKSFSEITEEKSKKLSDQSLNFIEDIKRVIKEEDNICAQLNQYKDIKVPLGVKTLSEVQDKRDEVLKELDANLTKAKIAKEAAIAAAAPTTATEEAKKIVEEEKAAVAKIEKEIEDANKMTNKFLLDQAFTGLLPIQITAKENALNQLSALGEKIGEDHSCDVEASNTNTPKNWAADMLKNFDSAILGTAK